MTQKIPPLHRTCFWGRGTITSAPGPNLDPRKFTRSTFAPCSRHDFPIAHLPRFSADRSDDLLVAPAPCAKRFARRRELHFLRLGTSVVSAAALGVYAGRLRLRPRDGTF